MLRVTADVNGEPIERLFIHNTGRHEGDIWEYDGALWNHMTDEGTFGIEGIRHNRKHPWYKLVANMVKALSLILIISNCGSPSPTQGEAATPTQAHMISKMNEWEPSLGMGRFILNFVEPHGLQATWAGWTACPGGEPWVVNINSPWIEGEASQERGAPYWDELLGHEMCHHYLGHTRNCSGTYDEQAANVCGHNLVMMGRPR